MSAGIPSLCKHLVNYKLEHGVNGYSSIQGMLRCSPNGRAVIEISKSGIFSGCSYCCGQQLHHQGRFLCLICWAVTCSGSNHTLLHSNSFVGHEIAVDVERAELYCCVCLDQVYDPDFDKVVVCKQMKMGGFGEKGGVKQNGCCDVILGKRKRFDFGVDLDSVKSVKKRFGLRWKQMSKSCVPLGLRGLNNLGNTCFMNSVLQALVHAPPLRNYFLNDGHSHEICKKTTSVGGLCLPCDMDVIFSAVFSGEKAPYSPAKFLYSWWQHSENHASYEQQDAHEFFISILDRIHEKLGKASLAPKGNGDCHCIAHRVFSGLLRSDVTCTSCGFTSSTYDPCVDISLDLNPTSTFASDLTGKPSKANDTSASSSLSRCLDLFTRPEKLGLDQKLYCENCQEKQNALKQMSIKKLPLVLCFHIKRFEHSPVRKASRKIERRLQFPFSLDMRPYLSPAAVRRRFGNRIFPFEGEESDSIGSTEFEVFAVVAHSGMMESGHYVTYVRSMDNRWYKCDDAWVTEVDVEAVRASQCYLMFYVQKRFFQEGDDELGCQPLFPLGVDPFVPIAGCC